MSDDLMKCMTPSEMGAAASGRLMSGVVDMNPASVSGDPVGFHRVTPGIGRSRVCVSRLVRPASVDNGERMARDVLPMVRETGGVPDRIMSVIRASGRETPLYLYRMQVPDGRRLCVLGYVLADPWNRLVEEVFTGLTGEQKRVFSAMSAMVAWDAPPDAFSASPAVAAALVSYAGRPDAARLRFADSGLRAVRPGDRHDVTGTVIMFGDGSGDIWAVRPGASDVMDGVRGASVEDIAGALDARIAAGLPRL